MLILAQKQRSRHDVERNFKIQTCRTHIERTERQGKVIYMDKNNLKSFFHNTIRLQDFFYLKKKIKILANFERTEKKAKGSDGISSS